MLYAAKCYWPGITRTELEHVTARTSGASSRPGTSEVNYLGSLLFSNDDLVLCLFEAPSPAAAKRASEQAGIPCERIMDAAWLETRHPRNEHSPRDPITKGENP